MTKANRLLATLLLVSVACSEAVAQDASNASHLVEIGQADSLYSSILGEERVFWVHLPNNGHLQENHRYPVIYLLDGGVHLGGLAMVQAYYTYFRLPEMIVVGISNRMNRTRDLTTSFVESRQGAPVEASGGAETFTRFIAEELIPHIDSVYPTSSHRTLIGHSYAGLFTINTLVHHRDLFTNYIAMDPSLDWDNQTLLHEATRALQDERFDGKGLFVSISNEIIRFSDTLTIDTVQRDTTDFSLSIRSMLAFVHAAEANTSNGLGFAWRYYDKDIHGSVPLPSMRDGLMYLYDWWELKSPSRYNDPDTPTQDLVRLITERSEKLTANMGYPLAMEEELLTMLGYMAMQMDQSEKARAVFELAIQFYPESASAQEAMADYYESQGDFANAFLHIQKALEISDSDVYKRRAEGLRAKQ
ncbi:MAG: alpha/beta hydrolase-fold protein [Rhodothermales bacterium]